jgi:hypothetical protein
MAVVLHAEPWEINARLRQLGIPSVDILTKAVKAAHTARSWCTENDPPFIHGTEAWRFGLRTAREELIATGEWRKDDIGNFALIINDTVGINVMVATGDENTGRKWVAVPKTRSPKGLYTEAAILRNVLKGDLFPETIPEAIVRKARVLEYPTWILLIYTTKYEARGELSYAADIDDGEIVEWRERIILPDIEIDPTVRNQSDDNDSGPDLDVDVTLKA